MKFTVAIPAYKTVFLEECIISVLNQTYTDFELIIVDDCSPNNVFEVVSKFKDKRISYYRNSFNYGAEHVVKNWNKCVEFAVSDYFVLMGDDDKMANNYLEEFVNLITKFPSLNVFHCRAQIIDENSKVISYTPSWAIYENVYENMWYRISGVRQQFVSDFVYRTSFLKLHGFFDLPLAWASDDITSYKGMFAKGIAHTNYPLLLYRSNQYSITSSGNVYLKLKAIGLEGKWLKCFLNEIPTKIEERIFYNNIIMYLRTYLEKKKIYTIAEELNKKYSLAQIFKLITNRNEFGMSYKSIIVALILSFKGRIKQLII